MIMKIGPFFYIRNKLIYKGCSLSEGRRQADKVDYSYGHEQLYDDCFATGDYIDYPRGRVIWDMTRKCAIVYIDPCINRREVWEQIREAFSLEEYTVESDEHYHCRQCMQREGYPDGDNVLYQNGSTLRPVLGSCAEQTADAVVNAANSRLYAGSGICGAIFRRAGAEELKRACSLFAVPLADGEAVVTPAFQMKNAKIIIHAVGPNFGKTPEAFEALCDAYYNSLLRLRENGYHSIAFPLIGAGVHCGLLNNPVVNSVEQCYRAFLCFTDNYPDYITEVRLCAFSETEMREVVRRFAQLQ